MKIYTRKGLYLVFCALALIGSVILLPSGYGQLPGSPRWEFNPDAVGTWSGASIGPQGTVYVALCQANGGGLVYALDGATGTKRWDYSSSCFVSTPAIGADGSSIYVAGGDNTVYAFSGETGTNLWTFQTTSPFEASPAIGRDGTIYVGCNDHKLYALDGMTGLKRWDYPTGGAIHESPAIGQDGTIYFGSIDGNVYALDGATGAKKWVFNTAGPVICSPAIGPDGTVYVGSGDKKVYALDGAAGTNRWVFVTIAPIDWSPAIADGMIYVGSTRGDMFSLLTATGQTCWSIPFFPISRAHPIVGANGDICIGVTNLMVAIAHITKRSPWAFTTKGINNSSPTIGPDGTLYVGSDNGPFYAIWTGSAGGLANSSWPMAGQNVRHTGAFPGAPLIFNEPVGQTARVGAAATLGIIAVGAPPLSFQWVLNGAPLADATNAALFLTNFQANLSGDYRVVVTNQLGAVASQVAVLSLSVPPSISAQPQSQAAVTGDTVNFTVAATGSEPLSYQWQFNGAALPGLDKSTLSLTNVGLNQAGAYTVVVTDSEGNLTSLVATLIVTTPARLTISRDLGVTLAGAIGSDYRIEYAEDLTSKSWILLTNLTMSVSPSPPVYPRLADVQNRFFRAALAP